VAPFVWAHSEDQAVRAAADLGYPVALKIVSPDIIHKFDVGRGEAGILPGAMNSGELTGRSWRPWPGPTRGHNRGYAGAKNGA